MTIRYVISLITFYLIFSTLAHANTPYEFIYELRVQKSLNVDRMTNIDLVTDTCAHATRIFGAMRHEEGDYAIFSGRFFSSLIYNSDKRRALIVTPYNHTQSISQVFLIEKTFYLKTTDWSQWKKPDYIEKSNAFMTFMYKIKDYDRSTNIPKDCFEMRFKITKSNLP